MEKLFVYGLLKDESVQKKVIGRVVEGKESVLEGYYLSNVEIEGKSYPIIIKGMGNISGKILDLTSDELKKIDKYETSAYAREKVKLKGGEETWVYKKAELTRAFIAIEFPDEVVKEIARVQELVSGVKFTGKMTELENLHLTLKFLGEIDDAKVEEIRKRLSGIKFDKMKLKLGKIGTFSIRGNPHIVWIKLEGAGIYELQKKIDEALSGLFGKEDRFMGHLTIARVKYVKDKKGFLKHLESVKVKQISFDVSEFNLKKSELKTLGPVYNDVEIYSSS